MRGRDAECYKWDGRDGFLVGMRYRAPYSANKDILEHWCGLSNVIVALSCPELH